MDPIFNPYTPGAGAKPAALVGRDKLTEDFRVSVERLKIGRPIQGMIMVGLRGVGKTVLLQHWETSAQEWGAKTLWVEAVEWGKAVERDTFSKSVIPQLRQILLDLSHKDKARDLVKRGMSALKAFASGVKLKFQDFEIGIDAEAEAGLADSGVFEHDFPILMEAVGEAAKAAASPVIMFVDEIQYVDTKLLSVLIVTMHRCTQKGLPVALFGAGLPQIRAIAAEVKSYTERMFLYPEIMVLSGR